MKLLRRSFGAHARKHASSRKRAQRTRTHKVLNRPRGGEGEGEIERATPIFLVPPYPPRSSWPRPLPILPEAQRISPGSRARTSGESFPLASQIAGQSA